jgi:hypothetical protein
MRRMLPVSILLILLAPSCAGINRDALAAWTAGDVALMQDLSDYRKAQGKPVDDITAHLSKKIGDIPNDEETGLMAELLALVQGDAKKSDTRKASYGTRITAHLNLFHSIVGR